MKIITLFFLSFLGSIANAQLPKTDIWLFEISEGKGTISLDSGRNISNHEGYDNQPTFSEDGKGLFYTSSHDDGQTEVMYFDLDSDKIVRLTSTPESEYSPLGKDKNTFQCVRVDKDSNQRIYSYQLPSEPKLLYKYVDSVGYFAIADWELVYFKISEPPSLWLADDGKKYMLSINPGRCIKNSTDKKKIWFTVNTMGNHLLMHSEGRNVLLQANLPDSAEFFEFWDEETVVISSQKGLQLFNIFSKSQILIPLPGNTLFKNISRLAISPDRKKLALVCSE